MFFERIKKEVGDAVPEESIYWAVKMIFGQLVHFGVILNIDLMKIRCRQNYSMGPNMIENSIHHSVKSHLNYLKLNPKLKKS